MSASLSSETIARVRSALGNALSGIKTAVEFIDAERGNRSAGEDDSDNLSEYYTEASVAQSEAETAWELVRQTIALIDRDLSRGDLQGAIESETAALTSKEGE